MNAIYAHFLIAVNNIQIVITTHKSSPRDETCLEYHEYQYFVNMVLKCNIFSNVDCETTNYKNEIWRVLINLNNVILC